MEDKRTFAEPEAGTIHTVQLHVSDPPVLCSSSFMKQMCDQNSVQQSDQDCYHDDSGVVTVVSWNLRLSPSLGSEVIQPHLKDSEDKCEPTGSKSVKRQRRHHSRNKDFTMSSQIADSPLEEMSSRISQKELDGTQEEDARIASQTKIEESQQEQTASTEDSAIAAAERSDCILREGLEGMPADRRKSQETVCSDESQNIGATLTQQFATRAIKEITYTTARDELDRTSWDNVRSLGQMYNDAMAEDSGYCSSPAAAHWSPVPHGELPQPQSPLRPAFEVSIKPDSITPLQSWHSRWPCKAGRKKLNIVAELRKHEPALLDKILSKFSVKDIVRFSGVCRDWRRIIEGNKGAASKKWQFLQHKQRLKEDVKENYPKHGGQRVTVSASTPLGVVQRVGDPQASSTPAPSLNNHQKFVKVSEFLLVDESLTRCVKGNCQSPARLFMRNKRGQCTRCGYDFCTNCLGQFHAGSPCRALQWKNSTKKPSGIGSGKSKMNLRRIARLESYP